MAIEEKSFLQTIKLEISRTFKLVPYERIVFHKILGILKSESAINIITKELDKGPNIRESAISTLVNINSPKVLSTLLPLLKEEISESEKIHILSYLEKCGSEEHINDITNFIDRELENEPVSQTIIARAFIVLKTIGGSSDDLLSYLLSLVSTEEINDNAISFIIDTLSSFKVISTFEDLLRRNDDLINYSVYKTIYNLSNFFMDNLEQNKTEEDKMYTYSPENEDKIILDIRVLLGKMTARFDGYTNRTKVAYISAMLSCNHREFLIYCMKALTSSDSELVSMLLYTLHVNIYRLRDPDKLFRSLLALTTETDRDNDIIVDIFVKYFSSSINTRQFHILQDKLYSYIVVTLESYFETYRKEFMITDVIEKGFPESFQRIRNFILQKFTPTLKKKITTFLSQEDPSLIRHLLDDLTKWTSFINDNEVDDLKLLLDILFDEDKKTRENSAARIENLKFEKRYLKTRIIRLCLIIEQLHINDASSALVNIYNYLKKYTDEDLMNASIHALSVLNYSYMLGEIEVLLTTGSDEDRIKALDLLSLFYEQRSLNILLEFLQDKISDESIIITKSIKILLERDIIGNATASQIFKRTISSNKNNEIRSLAILGIGKCGFDNDIEYLNELFYRMAENEPKDVIVRAIGSIISTNNTYNKRKLMKFMHEYLKDPGIKVRIYSCLILARLGNKDAIRSIRDMLIIKNKNIQRDILTILGDLRSIEFSFFLLSLLREEYGISRDIIRVIEMLPEEELKEIDGFIINIFRKYEAPEMEGIIPKTKEIIDVKNLREQEVSILHLEILYPNTLSETKTVPELINQNLILKDSILLPITNNNGLIACSSNNNIIAYFEKPEDAVWASLLVTKNIALFNKTRIYQKQLTIYAQIITDNVKIMNDELIEYPTYKIIDTHDSLFKNKILINRKLYEKIKKQFLVKVVPDITFSHNSYVDEKFEVINNINFAAITDKIIREITEVESKKLEMQKQLDEELKKLKRQGRSKTSIAIAKELDDIGNKLVIQLEEIERYVQRRSTDRELIKNVRNMLNNVYNIYKVEVSRIIID